MATTRTFLSADWYRIAPLKPRLRGQIEIHRQLFRGDVWYVVQDNASGMYHRITPAANMIVSMMDGRRTMAQLWDMACARFPDAPPTQPETIRLLSQLHAADLVAVQMPNIAELVERNERQGTQALLSRIRNPLAMRFALFDPDRFLTAMVWLVRPLFTVTGLVLWLGLVVTGITLAVLNWQALTGNLSDRVLTADNLLVLAIAFPLLKALHEMGHAFAVKVWGGEVHEIGVMLLVLMPVPFVDASAASGMSSKWRRAVVGGAGIMVELAVASIAMIVWVNAEPGFARALAFNLILIGGTSTLLFNGNPLLRFDGYYVFSDLLEIPGLGQRANKYFLFLIERHLFGVTDSESPIRGRGEAPILLVYAVAAFFYRVFISLVIALFIASRFLVIGVLLAAFALAGTFVVPLLKGGRYLLTSPRLRGRRGRVVGLTGGIVASLLVVILGIPLPYATVATGVVWLDDGALVRARTSGFVSDMAGDTREISAGTRILDSVDPDLVWRQTLTGAQVDEMQLRLGTARAVDRTQVEILRQQLALGQSQLDDITRRVADLAIEADRDGRLILPAGADLRGRLVTQGDLVGYLIDSAPMRLRVAVSQADAELVRSRTAAVGLRFARNPGRVVAARLLAEVPQTQSILPSLALATVGGGEFALDPARTAERATLQRVFLFDVVPLDGQPVEYVGERALVRFDLGQATLAERIWRSARQLFLRRFNV